MNDLRKKSSALTIQTQHTSDKGKTGPSGSSGHGAAGADLEINIEDLLNDLRRDIQKVYRVNKNTEMDLQAK